MEFAKTIIYVDDVEETLDFYYQAFGLSTIKDDGSTLTTAATEINFDGGKVTEPSTDQIRVEIAARQSVGSDTSGTFGQSVAPPNLTGYENGGLLKIRVGSTDYFIPAYTVSGGA